ncbi:hypothetical protein [Bizionia arctica]|uniref:Uncharacterized protein n=1 Tax=Bizionia arctica TaxID=1495645 RepID=A0A917GGW2_9FLAO|nr:hypothetical protein [Bizionia arctica]GGG45004.1 hypothetical protein GCM10010976_15750 [Bizionia arctica]
MTEKTILKTNSDKTNILRFKGITKKQIALLKENKLPFATILGLLGGMSTQYAFMSATGTIAEPEDAIDETIPNENEEEAFDFDVPTHIEFSDAVTEEMTFNEAFKAARQDTDGSGFFNWHGNTYHTLNKEEWEGLSDEERQEFFDKIQEHSDFNSGDYSSETDLEDNIPDEISYDDIMYDEQEYYSDSNIESDEFVTLDEIGDTVDIIDGLNDGKAKGEADGIDGGVEYIPEDIDNTSEFDIEYDDDELDYDTSDPDIEYDDDSLNDLLS